MKINKIVITNEDSEYDIIVERREDGGIRFECGDHNGPYFIEFDADELSFIRPFFD